MLCTSNRSFEVRQVQSSNVLYILQRSAESGFTAISQCKGVLELVPSKANAIEYIRQTLPRYTEDRTSQSNITRSLLSADAPFSEGELGNALTKLCVLQKDDLLWIPEPKALLTAWKSLLTVATINGVQLDHPWNIRELEHHVAEDGIDIEIFYAIVSRLTNRPQDVCEAALDACNCIVWIGRLVLDCKDKPIPKNEFVTEWQDLLLEPWRSGARLDLMKVGIISLST